MSLAPPRSWKTMGIVMQASVGKKAPAVPATARPHVPLGQIVPSYEMRLAATSTPGRGSGKPITFDSAL